MDQSESTDRHREIQESVAILRDRAARLPAELAVVLAAEVPALPLPRGDRTRFVVTGLGASEGPARLLVALLAELGLPAVFAPVSAFFGPAPRGDVLVVVSQQLSPNARLPLRRSAAYRAVALVTAVEAGEEVTLVLSHPPAREDRILLRVIGPAAAALVVTRAAIATAAALGVEPTWASALPLVPGAATAATAVGERAPPDLFERFTALVGSSGTSELLHLARLKLVEGLGLVDPPLWDACAVVHGPFQAFYERPTTLLCFAARGDESAARLLRGLEQSVVPERHRLWLHESTLPGPLAVFEHDAAVLGLVLGQLSREPRNLIAWPGKGADAAIYALGAD